MTEKEAFKELEARHLPSLLPSSSLLLQRTQTTLGLLREVKQESTAEYWYERGLKAAEAEEWDEAAYAYRQCVERNSEHRRGAVRLAAALGQLEQAEDAAVALTEASEVAMEGWNTLVGELDGQTWDLLRRQMESARGTARDGFRLLWGLVLVYRALAKSEQARQTLDVMWIMYEQQAAGSSQWFRLSGNLYLNAGLHIEAISDFDRAIELKPDYAPTYHDRGFSRASLQDYAGAVADCDRAIELKPDLAAAYYNRGNFKANLQDYAGAVVDFDRAIVFNPHNAFAYFNRGVVKANSQDNAGAIFDYNRFIELEPDFARSYRYRALSKEKLGDMTGAAADRDRAAQMLND